MKFFDPYLYRAGIEFASEEAASNYYLDKLREQSIMKGPPMWPRAFLEKLSPGAMA